MLFLIDPCAVHHTEAELSWLTWILGFLASCFGLMTDSAVVDSALVDAALRKSGLISNGKE